MNELAGRIIEDAFGGSVLGIRRFPTGLSHFVFEVLNENQHPYVVRIAKPERRAELESGIYWHKRLEALEIPLPEIYYTGEKNQHLFAVYERLPGTDLEDVYPTLTSGEKRNIARSVARIQRQVQSLDNKQFEDVLPWADVILGVFSRSERELRAKGENRSGIAERVHNQILEHRQYLDTVALAPFLYDLNVRNVMVQKGQVTGIIDVDELWLGDPLLSIGRGKVILKLMGQDTDFISQWGQLWNLSGRQRRAVDFYALLYCFRFMGTIGQMLNGNLSPQTDAASAPILESAAVDLLQTLERGTSHLLTSEPP